MFPVLFFASLDEEPRADVAAASASLAGAFAARDFTRSPESEREAPGMVRAHLVSLPLCALLPLQALAQAPTPPPLVPASSPSGEALPPAQTSLSGEEAPPQGKLIPHRVKRRPTSDPDSNHYSGEVLAGILLESAAAFPGMKVVWDGLFNADLVHSDSQLLIFGGLGLTAVAVPLGTTLGVMGAAP